jgi:hypothetical protein
VDTGSSFRSRIQSTDARTEVAKTVNPLPHPLDRSRFRAGQSGLVDLGNHGGFRGQWRNHREEPLRRVIPGCAGRTSPVAASPAGGRGLRRGWLAGGARAMVAANKPATCLPSVALLQPGGVARRSSGREPMFAGASCARSRPDGEGKTMRLARLRTPNDKGLSREHWSVPRLASATPQTPPSDRSSRCCRGVRWRAPAPGIGCRGPGPPG